MLRSARNYDMRAASRKVATVDLTESLTVQSQREEADINVLLRRFGVTGLVPQRTLPPLSGSFENVGSFTEAMQLVVEAKRSFMSLEAETRYRFRNDPALFVAFCENPANIEELRKLGLAPPKEVVRGSEVNASGAGNGNGVT